MRNSTLILSAVCFCLAVVCAWQQRQINSLDQQIKTHIVDNTMIISALNDFSTHRICALLESQQAISNDEILDPDEYKKAVKQCFDDNSVDLQGLKLMFINQALSKDYKQ